MIEPATRHVRLLLSFAILALFLSQSLAARCRGPRGISKSRQTATNRPVTLVRSLTFGLDGDLEDGGRKFVAELLSCLPLEQVSSVFEGET